jgi:hypothetical protein
MTRKLSNVITATEREIRDQSLDAICQGLGLRELLAELDDIDQFRRECDNLYQQVRALFFLHALHRYHLPALIVRDFAEKNFRLPLIKAEDMIPYEGYDHLLKRRFNEAIDIFLDTQRRHGPNDATSSALAAAYRHLGFQTLANQIRRSVRSVRGNQWMFRAGHPADHPLRLRKELLQKGADGLFPLLRERTPVRMDLSHSGWSDIFFLAMDYPEGARVLNISVDLGIHGRDAKPEPPIETFLRVIEEPVLRLVSVDLGFAADIADLAELFDFAKDYLGLIKAGVIASGLIPPGMEGSGASLAELLAHLLRPGLGLEIVSSVHNIPKGSRLAVSTSLLASLISLCKRATGQARTLSGFLEESERRQVAARAILGEWLGGSGGGWQDSGGVWPGIKLIQGMLAQEQDPEWGISRGCLLPSHQVLGAGDVPAEVRRQLQESLILVHGGMSQNVGPILEMVTERYLLRSEPAWGARHQAGHILDQILESLKQRDVKQVADFTMRNFFGPIQTIIPWASNLYTETLIQRARSTFGGDFWGFWMLGGMSGGGMGFIFAPHKKECFQKQLLEIMLTTKQELKHALPFSMDPVVYDFSINEGGTEAILLKDRAALLPQAYYALVMPGWLRLDPRSNPPARQSELHWVGVASKNHTDYDGIVETLFDRMVPHFDPAANREQGLSKLLNTFGFDRTQHEQIRADLKKGRIGLAQNRLPADSDIQDVREEDVMDVRSWFSPARKESTGHEKACRECGEELLARGEVAVLTLAAGVGSRWTQGAGVVKALHPFCKLAGRHRTFLEVHLAKSRRVGGRFGTFPPHIVSTSYLTHQPIAEFLSRENNYGYPGPLFLSPGRSVGLRLIPMARDLRFLWEETIQQQLDERSQKVRESLHSALIQWALQSGEGNDYADNIPLQCLHPVGHWYEIPNLLKNGLLSRLLDQQPDLRFLMVHNIDTLGADLNPALLGLHALSEACLTFEVIPRRLEDRGGGLARVGGRTRLVEGLAMPREEDEFRLSYYNSNTAWVNLPLLLHAFGLEPADLSNPSLVNDAVRNLAARMPSYVTLKEVKKRWGHGLEDIYPVAQFEKLWGDMSSLSRIKTTFAVVPRLRGQQLKEIAQLDGWFRDGSAAYVESLIQNGV